VAVGKVGNGNGTVTGPGIECGTQCTGSFNPGTRLQATAAPGSSFAGWGGACGGTALCILGMSADATVTARFVRIPKGVGLQTAGANADSVNPVVSGNGQFVAYESAATTLTGNCPSGRQIYLRDLATGVITCISRSPGGLPGNGPSMLPAISADGQIITFQSLATNLGSCPNGVGQIFVHARQAGTTTCVSLAGGGQGDGLSEHAALSADGRFVAFRSLATNLGSCPNGLGQIFVRDRQTSTTTCVSLAGGGQGDGPSANPVLSGDGRFAAFDSAATNLDGACFSGSRQIFVRDRNALTTTCESISPGGGEGDSPSLAPALDASGNVLAFESTATNLAGPCTDGVFSQIFVRDRTTGITGCGSVAPDGSPGDGPSTQATLSANGRRLAFVSRATNLFISGVPPPAALAIRGTPSDTDQVLGSDVGATGTGDELEVSSTETLSESGAGDLGGASSDNPTLNDDGSVTAFDSAAQNLTNGETTTQNVLTVQASGRARFTAPAQGTQLNLDAPTVVTINWTVVGGAAQYGVEFTGVNRQFANPNAAGPDPVNGFGGAGGAFAVPGTSVTGALDPSIPPGVYQVRVLGLSASLQPIGTFSDALTLVLGFSQRPAFISPASGTVLAAGTALTLAWTPVPGAVQYGLEFTGANRQFANPNGTANDPVNGFGGAGGGSLATGTGFTVTLPAGIPPGSYQVRVIGLTATLALVGVFSDAVTVVAP
jgi:List-Bact-rpt repeat protein/WD40 repeat protein